MFCFKGSDALGEGIVKEGSYEVEQPFLLETSSHISSVPSHSFLSDLNFSPNSFVTGKKQQAISRLGSQHWGICFSLQ